MAVKKIILKGEDLCIRKEGFANGAVTPGDLVTALPGGDVTVNSTAADADAQIAFAYENEVVGQDIDTDYADNDTCLYFLPARGVEVYANGAAAITAGAAVEASATGGAVQTATTGRIVGFALESIGGAGRVKIEIA